MKHFLFTAIILSCVLPVSAQIQHRWVCVDNGANKLAYVNQFDPSMNWVVTIPGNSRDMQVVDRNMLLVSHGNGAAEYSLADGKRGSWVVACYNGVQSARRLSNGHTLLCTAGGMLYEVDADGKELSRTQIDLKGLNLRLMRLLPNGNLLIGSAGPKAVLEAARDGRIIRNLPLPGKGYTAIQLEDGRIVAGTGEEARIITMDANGKQISVVGGKDTYPDLGLDFCSGWDLLPNGNLVMANWLGHGKQGTGPHLVEFNTENKLVWQWGDHKMMRQVTNVLILDKLKD